ncbi:MAG: PilN domain-containing protein [Candidatus Omnitrophota bacterium]
MLTINLLPRNLKITERKIMLPYKIYIFIVIVVLIFLHLCLFSLAVAKKIQILSLRGSWGKVELQFKDSVSIKAEIKGLEAKANSMKDILSRKANMTELLSSLGLAVPKGLWLERFTYSNDGLIIQGSVVSLTQNEMSIIGKFLQDIKNNKTFVSLFAKIELNSVQRRTIKAYDVVDFVVVGEIKK